MPPCPPLPAAAGEPMSQEINPYQAPQEEGQEVIRPKTSGKTSETMPALAGVALGAFISAAAIQQFEVPGGIDVALVTSSAIAGGVIGAYLASRLS